MTKRACAEDGCITILSSHNPGQFCWVHAPDAPRMPNVKTRKHERFINGMPGGTHDPTPEDRRRYKEGGGAY